MSNAPQIVTVTFNPAIDQTVFVGRLTPGTVHRATRSHRQAGGKGVNVATMLALGGAQVAVTGFLGEDNADIFERHFRQHGLHDEFVRVAGETRTGIKVIDATVGQTTDLNLSGVAPTPAQLELLCECLERHARPGVWVVLAGSLPAGVDPDYVVTVIRRLRAAGAKVAVDSSGPGLVAAVSAGVDLAKPNADELAELLGRPLPDLSSTLSAARDLRRTKIPNLIVSLGAQGALFLTPEAELLAVSPPVNVVSTVGAGDSLLAGYLQGLLTGQSPDQCARLATVYAWSRLESLDPALPAAKQQTVRLAAITVRSMGDRPIL